MTAAVGADGDRLVDRIAKLLAQAEGTDNEHEAAAFVERAQLLATSYAVDLELARVRQRDLTGRSGRDPMVQERVEIGERGRRGNRHRVLLYVVVAAANDVLVNVAHDSTYVLGFGHRADLEVVERLWASLAVQMTAASQRRMDRGEHRAERVAGMTWRLSFYDGFVDAVGERLQDARRRAVQQVEAAAPAGAVGAELVLREKAERVKDFYGSASTARGAWRGAWAGRTQVSGHATRSGRADGRQADLGQPRVRQRGQLGA
ncbi:MAG TPA: DUF2786 domain-containing protein [Mycobacteriales bacterium]|nr:DUF2786 domain-containing protein [Mycobacteriales bacterium]